MNFPLGSTAARFLTVISVAILLLGLTAAAADAYQSDNERPELVTLLSGMNQFWESEETNNLHGQVKNSEVLGRNDELAVWINNHATSAQQFKALQDANDTTYQVASDGLGSELGEIYLHGLKNAELPLTNALLGEIINYVNTEGAKTHYSYPRPYLRSDTGTSDSECGVATYNASSLKPYRLGKSYADSSGNLDINRLASQTDNTGKYTSVGTNLSAGYSSFCGSGSFPSGHATGAYLGDLTLATLVPQLAPSILARASEQGNNRIVLGVHYPLDVMGGRIAGEAGVATRWSDAEYRENVIKPAREELVAYLEKKCGGTLEECIANQTPYQDDPYNGSVLPGGSSQTVTDEASAVAVYTERLTYGFPRTGTIGLAPSVPAKAANLLISTYPTLTTAQRTEVLGQTEIESGYPLDRSGSAEGSWERLNLAAAMSAKVEVETDGTVKVLGTGGKAEVLVAREEEKAKEEVKTGGETSTGNNTSGNDSTTSTSSSSTNTSPPGTQGTTATKAPAAKAKSRTSLKIGNAKTGGPKLTVKVTASGSGAQGSVRIYVDSKAVKKITLKNGTATVTLTKLAHGQHKVKAVYLGDSSTAASTSSPIGFRVTGGG